MPDQEETEFTEFLLGKDTAAPILAAGRWYMGMQVYGFASDNRGLSFVVGIGIPEEYFVDGDEEWMEAALRAGTDAIEGIVQHTPALPGEDG